MANQFKTGQIFSFLVFFVATAHKAVATVFGMLSKSEPERARYAGISSVRMILRNEASLIHKEVEFFGLSKA